MVVNFYFFILHLLLHEIFDSNKLGYLTRNLFEHTLPILSCDDCTGCPREKFVCVYFRVSLTLQI
jgi:hypothetical protein